jgi:hypothetical protein
VDVSHSHWRRHRGDPTPLAVVFVDCQCGGKMAQYDVGQSAAGRIRRGQPGEYVFAGRLAARPPSQLAA